MEGSPIAPSRACSCWPSIRFGAKVLSAVASRSGTLRLLFDTGIHLTCSPDRSLEAWQAVGPAGWRLVSLSGGDLVVRPTAMPMPWRGFACPCLPRAPWWSRGATPRRVVGPAGF
ncbi:DUF6188 family protein [Streptomyces sp. NPDC002785]|uniref:DUF6188 family protein n=1 Tax=Streptomyces sp. NPDC002785 TaxID=3154543 RepID=UPI0033333081